MNPLTYQIIHYVGIFALLFALGSLFTKYNKGAVIGHGIALLLILVGGFGMQAKYKAGYAVTYGSTWPTWLIVKIVIWVIFGGIVVLAKKNKLPTLAAWLLCVGLASAAAYLAMFKPF